MSEIFPFLSKKTREIAVSFAQIGSRDLKCSLELYKLELYAQSIYHFQQAVEKSAKAYGLLSGVLHPTANDLMREVSHRSVLGIILRMPELIENYSILRERARVVLQNPKLKEIGFSQFLEERILNQPVADTNEVRATIQQINSLDPGRLWRLTLDLETNHAATQAIMKLFAEANKKWQEAEKAQRFFDQPPFQNLKKLMEHPEDVDYFLNIYLRARPELIPLTIVSMCHEKETRYPAISDGDYWNANEYTKEKGLIKNYDLLYTHADRMCNSVVRGSQAALIHSLMDP